MTEQTTPHLQIHTNDAITVDGTGQAVGTTFSFREANITPGTQISCSGATNSCANVPNPVIPSVGGGSG